MEIGGEQMSSSLSTFLAFCSIYLFISILQSSFYFLSIAFKRVLHDWKFIYLIEGAAKPVICTSLKYLLQGWSRSVEAKQLAPSNMLEMSLFPPLRVEKINYYV